MSPQAALLEAVEDAGFGARLLNDGADRTRARLRVEGMLCSSCSGKVEAALRAEPGVREAAVSLVTHKAEVGTHSWNHAISLDATSRQM